jgi:hypothetical protein
MTEIWVGVEEKEEAGCMYMIAGIVMAVDGVRVHADAHVTVRALACIPCNGVPSLYFTCPASKRAH